MVKKTSICWSSRIPSLTIISYVGFCTYDREMIFIIVWHFLLVLENSKTRKKFEWKRCHKIIFIECNCKSADKVFYTARETHKLRLLPNLIENVILSLIFGITNIIRLLILWSRLMNWKYKYQSKWKKAIPSINL